MSEKENEERIEKIEEQLIEQEHRLFPVLNNFFIKRPKWPSDDPRRTASAKALIWALFFSPGTVAVVGSVIAIATVGVFIWQNSLIKEQNKFFQEQIKQQQTQIESQKNLSDQVERNKAIQIIYGPDFKDNPRIKSEAVRTFIIIERERIAKEEKRNTSDRIVVPSASVDLSNADLQNISIFNYDFSMVNFINSNLTKAELKHSNLTKAKLQEADLINTNLLLANLTNANLREANLTNVDFMGSNLTNINLEGTDLANADLHYIQNWRDIKSIKGANITGVKNPPEGFIEWALENEAVIEPSDSETPTPEPEGEKNDENK